MGCGPWVAGHLQGRTSAECCLNLGRHLRLRLRGHGSARHCPVTPPKSSASVAAHEVQLFRALDRRVWAQRRRQALLRWWGAEAGRQRAVAGQRHVAAAVAAGRTACQREACHVWRYCVQRSWGHNFVAARALRPPGELWTRPAKASPSSWGRRRAGGRGWRLHGSIGGGRRVRCPRMAHAAVRAHIISQRLRSVPAISNKCSSASHAVSTGGGLCRPEAGGGGRGPASGSDYGGRGERWLPWGLGHRCSHPRCGGGRALFSGGLEAP
jgi:hypothetical protein